jgi:hypothetical protein
VCRRWADAVGDAMACRARWGGGNSGNAGGCVGCPVSLLPAGFLPGRLSFGKREELAFRPVADKCVRMIAQGRGPFPSTISRELSRGIGRATRGIVLNGSGQRDDRARRPKLSMLAGSARLR